MNTEYELEICACADTVEETKALKADLPCETTMTVDGCRVTFSNPAWTTEQKALKAMAGLIGIMMSKGDEQPSLHLKFVQEAREEGE